MVKILPPEAINRLFVENDVIGLKMLLGSDPTIFYLLVKTVEGPNDLDDYSLGSATGQDTDGTGWNEIEDANSRYLLEPEFANIIFQAFYGVYPSYAWIYRRYPPNVDRGSLRRTRTIGDRTYRIGKVDGLTSPYHTPSSRTEFFTMEGEHPAFLGFHPRLEPSSVTIRMNFSVVRYRVEHLKSPESQQISRAKVRTMFGEDLAQAPSWLR